MKKLISVLLFALCLALLASCAPKPAAAGTTLRVGVIQFVEHPSLNEIYTSFAARLEAEAAKSNVAISIDYQNGQGDPSIINTICQKFVGDKVDLIVAIATNAAQGAANAITGTDIPLVFSAVTDPIAAGLLKDMAKPEGNITGTSDAIPVDKIFNLAFELTPEIKTIGTVYTTSEPNSKVVVEQAREYLKTKGIELTQTAVTAVSEIQTAAQSLAASCDAIFVPIDNNVATAMPMLSQIAIDAKKPIYAAADSMVGDGALASVGVNYVELGEKTADMALKVLSGTKPQDMPVQLLENNLICVNDETAAAIGVDVSKYSK